MAAVSFNTVCKTYPDGTRAVESLDLAIEDGELMVLVGPSGSGKTTALRMVAGLEEITEGTIEIGGRVVNDVAPRDRDIAMVFQNYALYPHMTVFDNIGFGLRLRKQKKDAIQQSVLPTSQMLGLDQVLAKKPRELSGGQRQRVAMGRAIVRQPQVFLMDEPLSNLDAQLRVQMRAEIRRLQRDLGVTMLYVTHDQVEAMTLGDRVAVFQAGALQQVAKPAELYSRPVNTFVAAFIGSPSMNFLTVTLNERHGTLRASSGDDTVELGPNVETDHPRLPSYLGRTLLLGVRPEDLHPTGPGPADRAIRARVELVEVLGSEILVHASTAASLSPGTPPGQEGPAGGSGALLIARSGVRAEPATGQEINLRPDPTNLHFFDPESGEAI